LQVRFDAKFHAGTALGGASVPLLALGDLVVAEPDYGVSARAVPRTSEGQPRYIRITDFGDDGVPDDHEYAAPSTIDWSRRLEGNDLLFARSGATVGKTYLHEDTSVPAIFAGYCIRFRLNATRLCPRFAYWWTKTSAFARWVARIQRPSGQPNINKEEFKSHRLPVPDQHEQQRLVAAMDAARKERRAKLAEADALLEMDALVHNLLGMAILQKDWRGGYGVTLASIKERGRANADFHHPNRTLTLRALEMNKSQVPVTSLAELADFPRYEPKPQRLLSRPCIDPR
jgi:hypothetical protein